MVGRHARTRPAARRLRLVSAGVVVVLGGAALGVAHLIESPASRGTAPRDTATSSTSSSTLATTTTRAPTVTISAVGDTELGNTPQLPAAAASYLRPIASVLAAPIVFGNLEGTL